MAKQKKTEPKATPEQLRAEAVAAGIIPEDKLTAGEKAQSASAPVDIFEELNKIILDPNTDETVRQLTKLVGAFAVDVIKFAQSTTINFQQIVREIEKDKPKIHIVK